VRPNSIEELVGTSWPGKSGFGAKLSSFFGSLDKYSHTFYFKFLGPAEMR
jgi:hypothetical protein